MHEVRLGMGSDSRIGNQFLFSGLGYGGSCFPKDLEALIYTKKMHKIESGLIEQTVQVNNSQVKYFLKKIFNKYRGALNEKSIAIWGVAFKSGTDDLRSSISLEIIHSISSEVKSVHLFDVLATKKAISERTQDLENIFIHNDKYMAAKKADILIIANDDCEFKNIDFSKLKLSTIFDGRNILDRGDVENHGIDYFGIGT
jgi:UDPglucose 6-dehydrogenase